MYVIQTFVSARNKRLRDMCQAHIAENDHWFPYIKIGMKCNNLKKTDPLISTVESKKNKRR